MSILVKKETVYDQTILSDTKAYFLTDEEEPRVMTLSRQDWEDFGSPAQITVTVEAGDLLNKEEE